MLGFERICIDEAIGDEEGAVAIEFAFVCPVLIFLLMGIAVIGSYLGVAHGLQEAAGHAARASVAGMSTSERAALARRSVEESVAGSLLLRADATTVEAAPDAGDPDRFRVTVRYDLRRTLAAAVPRVLRMPDILERTAVIRRGGL
jgi:Flp pilus assembly protein TadG